MARSEDLFFGPGHGSRAAGLNPCPLRTCRVRSVLRIRLGATVLFVVVLAVYCQSWKGKIAVVSGQAAAAAADLESNPGKQLLSPYTQGVSCISPVFGPRIRSVPRSSLVRSLGLESLHFACSPSRQPEATERIQQGPRHGQVQSSGLLG